MPKHLLPAPPKGAAPKKKEKKAKAAPKARSAMEAKKQAEKEAARLAKEGEGPAAESSLAVSPSSGIIPPHGECSVSVLCVAGTCHLEHGVCFGFFYEIHAFPLKKLH